MEYSRVDVEGGMAKTHERMGMDGVFVGSLFLIPKI